MATRLKKIAPRTVLGKDIKTLATSKGNDVMTVFGIAKDTKAVETNYGTSIAFLGTFEATNIETGEVFRAATLYLPEIAQDVILELFDARKENNEEQTPIYFGFVIGVKYDERAATGYTYTVKPVVEAIDPLDNIRAKIGAETKTIADANTETKPEVNDAEVNHVDNVEVKNIKKSAKNDKNNDAKNVDNES